MTQRNPDSAPYLQLLMEAGSQKFSDRMVKLNSPVFVGRQTFEHHGKGTKEAVCPTGYKCSFDVNGNGVPCGMHFLDRKQLNRHKVDAKHINFKKKKADGDEDNNEVEAVAE